MRRKCSGKIIMKLRKILEIFVFCSFLFLTVIKVKIIIDGKLSLKEGWFEYLAVPIDLGVCIILFRQWVIILKNERIARSKKCPHCKKAYPSVTNQIGNGGIFINLKIVPYPPKTPLTSQ